MTKSFKFFAVVFLATLSFSICDLSAQGPGDIKMKVENMAIDFIQTPNIQYSPDNVPGTKRRDWLRIIVEYSIDRKRQELRDGTSISGYATIDDLVIQFNVILPAVHQGQKVPALMSKRVKYWAIPRDGEKHWAVAFIPPQVLERYAPEGLKTKFNGKTMHVKYSRSFAKDLPIMVTIYNKSNQALAIGFNPKPLVPRSKSDLLKRKRLFDAAEQSLGILKLDDTLFSRDETPWANLNYETFELIKKDK